MRYVGLFTTDPTIVSSPQLLLGEHYLNRFKSEIIERHFFFCWQISQRGDQGATSTNPACSETIGIQVAGRRFALRSSRRMLGLFNYSMFEGVVAGVCGPTPHNHRPQCRQPTARLCAGERFLLQNSEYRVQPDLEDTTLFSTL